MNLSRLRSVETARYFFAAFAEICYEFARGGILFLVSLAELTLYFFSIFISAFDSDVSGCAVVDFGTTDFTPGV
jgi:hypothetical protein